MTVRVLIVDDEPHARAGLRRIVDAQPGYAVAGECRDGASALAAIASEAPDVVLLDVQMPAPGGLDVVRSLPKQHAPAIVFVTAYDHFAVQAFEAHAVDYVLKPFSDRRLVSAMERSREELRRRRVAALADHLDRVVVRSIGRTDVVPVREIEWIEASDYCVKLHGRGRTVVHRESLGSLERRLSPGFVRAHRAALVNVRWIAGVQGDDILLSSGRRIPISRSRRAAVERAIERMELP